MTEKATKIFDALRSAKTWRITNVRIISQIFFFSLFFFFVWATWTSRLGGYPVSRILEMDPLVMISTMLSTGYVYRYLGWGLLILAITEEAVAPTTDRTRGARPRPKTQSFQVSAPPAIARWARRR